MKIFVLVSLFLFLHVGTASAEVPAPLHIVTSIPPIHSLTAAIMTGTGEPKLLLRGGGSPHSFSLRPSDMSSIQEADLIIWVGPMMEQFLTKAIRIAPPESETLTLINTPGLTLHPVREGGLWGDDRQIDHHDDHTTDPHVWLNPDNAMKMAEAIRDQLSEIDPQRSPVYRQNCKALTERLLSLDQRLKRQLQAIHSQPYIVFHDAYQTFESHFGLSPVGSVTIDPERKPGARRLQEIRDNILHNKVVCIFSEPQFEPRYIVPLTEGTTLRTGILDPLGSDLPPGPELYFDLMQGLANALVSCLNPANSPPKPD